MSQPTTGKVAARRPMLIAMVVCALVPGIRLLPGLMLEHYAVLALVLVLALRPWRWILGKSQGMGAAVLLAWCTWQALITILRSPAAADGLAVIGRQAGAIAAAVVVLLLIGASRDRYRQAQKAVLHGTAILSAVSVMEVLGWISLGSVAERFDGNEGYAAGLQLEANLFGSQCAAAIVIGLRLTAYRVGPRAPVIASIGACGVGLMLSATRAAVLAVVIAIVLHRAGLWIERRESSGGRPTVVAPALLCLGAALLLVAAFSFMDTVGRSSVGTQFESGTGGYRVETWRLAWSDLQDRPSAALLGHGVGSFGAQHSNPFVESEQAYLANFPLATVYDGGIVGLALAGFGMYLLAGRPRRLRDLDLLAVLLTCSIATNQFWFAYAWIILCMSRPPHSKAATSRRSSGSTSESQQQVAGMAYHAS